MANPFVGEIRPAGFNFAPYGWALCQGQLLAISQNTALFSLLGTYYGGDGVTTFALPDLRGRVALSFGTGSGLSTYVQGETGGQENVTVSTNLMPAHRHALNASDQPAKESAAAQNYLPSNGGRGTPLYASTDSSFPTMNQQSVSSTGASQPHPNQQPYLVVNYIIALVGIYPARS